MQGAKGVKGVKGAKGAKGGINDAGGLKPALQILFYSKHPAAGFTLPNQCVSLL
jgi:hypothetical protein